MFVIKLLSTKLISAKFLYRIKDSYVNLNIATKAITVNKLSLHRTITNDNIQSVVIGLCRCVSVSMFRIAQNINMHMNVGISNYELIISLLVSSLYINYIIDKLIICY